MRHVLRRVKAAVRIREEQELQSFHGVDQRERCCFLVMTIANCRKPSTLTFELAIFGSKFLRPWYQAITSFFLVFWRSCPSNRPGLATKRHSRPRR